MSSSTTNKQIVLENTLTGNSIDFKASTAGSQYRDCGIDVTAPAVDGFSDFGTMSINAGIITIGGFATVTTINGIVNIGSGVFFNQF